MSSSGLPTYSSTAPSRPELDNLNMSNYFSGATNSPITTPPVTTGYDEEATQTFLKRQGGSILRKKVPSLEKDELKSAQHDTSRHAKSYSLALANPPDNVVVNQSMRKNKVGRLYGYLLTTSIVTRWILFIIPVLALLWIPGILALTTYPKAAVWGVGLLWWSIWLSVLWGGWWAALAASRLLPVIIRSTIGVVAVSSRKYIDWMYALHRYTAFFAWSVLIWVSYLPIISIHRSPSSGSDSANAIDIIGKLLLGSVFCSGILLFEKFSIQWIAGKFHERSYAERIADQKAAVKALVTLYRHSVNVAGRTDTLQPENKASMFRKFRHQVRLATTTTATVFGNLASEIAGSSVLQPNSPQAIIKTALESPNKSRLLARRIFYSFAKKGADYIELEDIEKLFPTREEAWAAFALFDQDSNGDISREELEVACLGFHREQLSIESSMQNLDSAVGRLDNIFMSLYVIIAVIIFAAVLDTHVGTLLTGAGASFLGLTWLIGGTCQEILTSVIFLFIKHPFDVGDRVKVKDDYYTVKEIRLLSTILLDKNSTLIQAPNSQLTTQFISNFRRSPHMSETFTFDVSYGTTFRDLEKLREKMLEFVKGERRGFEPVFDVTVLDIPDQEKMTLSTDIRYRSNIQHDALKVKRRNKWICALKNCLSELKIYGPAGNPESPPKVNRYTEVPWEVTESKDKEDKKKKMQELLEEEERRRAGQDWKLGDKNAVLMDSADEVFGERAEVRMTNPRHGLSETSAGVSTSVSQRPIQAAEVFEMESRSEDV